MKRHHHLDECILGEPLVTVELQLGIHDRVPRKVCNPCATCTMQARRATCDKHIISTNSSTGCAIVNDNTQLDLGWTDALQYMQGSVDQPVQDNGVLTGVAETVVELQLLQQYGLRQPALQQVRCYVVAHCSCTVSLNLMLVERSHATCSPDVRGQSNN